MMFQGYGRGAGLIEKFAPKEMANDKTFDVWVEAARAERQGAGCAGRRGALDAVQGRQEHQKEAVEFLKFFYQDDNYLEYVATVPIHLFPITKSLRAVAEISRTSR